MQLAFDFGAETCDSMSGADSPCGERDSGRRRDHDFSARTAEYWRDHYFFAILPDKAAAAQIGLIAAGLRRRYQLKGRLIAADRYHVSLHGGVSLDRTPADLVARMRRAADTISATNFMLCFEQALSFSRRAETRALVLSSNDEMPALNAFHGALGRAMSAAGLPTCRSFTPHLTMLYDTRIVPVTEVPRVCWTVHDFVLIRSLHGLSRYDQLGRWPLKNHANTVI